MKAKKHQEKRVENPEDRKVDFKAKHAAANWLEANVELVRRSTSSALLPLLHEADPRTKALNAVNLGDIRRTIGLQRDLDPEPGLIVGELSETVRLLSDRVKLLEGSRANTKERLIELERRVERLVFVQSDLHATVGRIRRENRRGELIKDIAPAGPTSQWDGEPLFAGQCSHGNPVGQCLECLGQLHGEEGS